MDAEINASDLAERRSDALTLAKGAGVSLAGRVSGRALQLLSMIALGRVLGPSVFGVYAIGWTLLRMLGFLSTLGSDRGMVRYGSRYWQDDAPAFKGTLIQTLLTASVASGLLAVALYYLAPTIANDVFDEPRLANVIRWFAPGLILFSAMKVAAAATRATQRMQYSVASQDIGQPAFNLLLIVVFFLAGYRLGGAVAAAVLSFGAAFCIALVFVGRLAPGMFGPSIRPRFVGKELLYFSIPASLAGMLGAYLVWVDRLILGYFRPSAEVGVYHAVSQFSVLFAVLLAAIGAIGAPMIARFHHRGEIERLRELYRVSTKWALYLSIPAFLVIFTGPRELLTILFGADYATGWLALVILAGGQLVNAGTGTVNALLVMTGHQKMWLLLSATTLAVNIILNVTFIPRWGLNGAALATAIALVILFAAGVVQIRVVLGTWPYDSRVVKGIVATGVAAAALAALRLGSVALSLPAGAFLVLTVIVAALAFGGTLLGLGFDDEDRFLLQAILASARSKRRA